MTDIAAPQLATIRRLTRGYCILEASIRETAPGRHGLTKDMPILPKTNILSIETEIIRLIKAGLAPAVPDDKRNAVTLRTKFRDVIAALRTASGSGRDETDFYEETDAKGGASASRHVYGVKDHQKPQAASNYILLMEYRRVPILPVGEWVECAMLATTELGYLG